MRIGILTFHRSINYGAFMQSYALSQTLKKRYQEHTIEIIDFEYLWKHNHYKTPPIKLPPFNWEYYIQYNRFQSSLSILPLSKQSFITNEVDSLCEYIKANYDIVIVGSDAVWAFQRLKLDNPYWLFGKKLNGIIKMSYAASAFSTRFEKITDEEKGFIKERLSDFTYIGVRDNATKEFVDSLNIGQEVFINNDPTFFLEPSSDKELYKKTLRKNLVFSNKKKIAFMTRHMPYINDIRNDLGSKFNFVHFHIRNSSKDIFSTKCKYMPNVSPLEWYNAFGQMLLTITNYFHGACLSIINHTPTIMVDDSTTSYTSKYSQLMCDLGLKDSLFKTFNYQELSEHIHYLLTHQDEEKLKISKAIQRERLKSQSFFDKLDSILLK